MMTKFEVRQQVRTVGRRWLETVYTSESDRVARLAYDRFVQEYPGEYFELVKVTRDEECLAFTPKKDGE